MNELSVKSLTDLQQKFVQRMIEGFNQTDAAAAAGYKNPGQDGYRLMLLPHIHEAIHAKRVARILSGQGLALTTIFDIMQDPKANAGIRLQAAKYVVDKGDEIRRAHSLSDLLKHNPDSLTSDQLEIYIRQSEAIIRKVENRKEALEEIGLIEQ